ncbi:MULTISPECIES: hypothetical protein [unclassified Pseudomonas]|uniref:hypothetical protein n=1 Tax=unclassified Pseudomonas TaxID=196821 RepID=UPI0011A161B8|nr:MULTISPECIES: hypothetical protein [unclassified Pseudomonas]
MRKAREDIFGLVQMHAGVSRERDQLRAELNRALATASDANRRVTDIETKTNGEFMANAKLISELHARLRELTGVDPFTQILPH